jgi:hypothetical protein
MKINYLPLIILIFLLTFTYCSKSQKEDLFNGKDLNNWTITLKNPQANPDSVFSVADGMINVSGLPFGYLRTKKEYKNYKLHAEYRWIGTPTNSGIFLNVTGADKIWPLCMECQLMNSKAGDIILMGLGGGITRKDTAFISNNPEKPNIVVRKFENSSEKPAGEWNTVDIVCTEKNLEIKVNGVLKNNGTNLSLTSGAICLQSEGGPLQFRNVYIEMLK